MASKDEDSVRNDQLEFGRMMAGLAEAERKGEEPLRGLPETTAGMSFEELLAQFTGLFDQVTNGSPASNRRMRLILTALFDLEGNIRKDEQRRIRGRMGSYLQGFVSTEIDKRRKEMHQENMEAKRVAEELRRERKEMEAERKKNSEPRMIPGARRVISADGEATIKRLRETIAFQNEELKRLGSSMAV